MLIYDPTKTYEENFNRELSEFSKLWYYPHKEPKLKLSAGPALNSNYVNLFSRIGYDLVTYKTVSLQERKAHPFPNIHVKSKGKWLEPNKFNWNNLNEIEAITNYFGLPSKNPEYWLEDIQKIKEPSLVLSVVGKDLKEFDQIINLALDAEPDVQIELDLSCPNLKGVMFYNDVNFIKGLTQIQRNILRNYDTNFIAKVGLFKNKQEAMSFVNNSDFYAIESTNAVPKSVKGIKRGVCGPELLEDSIRNVELLDNVRKETYDFKIIGTGGVRDRETAMNYIEAGADIIGVATMAMFDPYLPQKIKESS